jgi:DNA-binding phage protein
VLILVLMSHINAQFNVNHQIRFVFGIAKLLNRFVKAIALVIMNVPKVVHALDGVVLYHVTKFGPMSAIAAKTNVKINGTRAKTLVQAANPSFVAMTALKIMSTATTAVLVIPNARTDAHATMN